MDEAAYHLLITAPDGTALACGRLHLNSNDEAQIRYMAVAETARGRGYGRAILKELEKEAARRGACRILLNARENGAEFYRKSGYAIIGDGPTLFGQLRHFVMSKIIH